MVKYLLNICFALLISTSAWAQYTTTRVSVDDSASPLIGGSTNKVVFAFSVAKTAGDAASNLTNIVINTGSTDPNTVFSSVQLKKSTSNFAGSIATGATPTLNAGNITFAGAPIHVFTGAAETEFFYVVATVNPAVATTVATVPSITLGAFTEANTTYSAAITETAFSFSGSLYNFQALAATVTQQTFTSSYIGGATDKPIYGFKVTTNGTSQDLSQVVFTLDIDPTNAAKFSTFKLVNNGASSTYTPAGATLAAPVLTATTITFNLGASVAPISSSDKYFFLVANVSTAMASATVVSTLTSAAVNNPVGAGGVIGAGVGTNQSTTITALAATVTQQTFAASYVGGATDKPIYGFKVTTNGTSQDLSQVVFTLDIDPTNAAKFSTFKLVDNGASSTYTPAGATLVAAILAGPAANTVTFNMGAAVAPISSLDKYFFLVANVSPAMASATVVTTLTSVAVNNPVGAGGVIGTGVGTNQSTTITALAATVTQQTFTANYDAGNTDKAFYGFKITTNGTTQDLSQVVFTLNINPTDAAKLSTFKLVNNGASSTYAGGGSTVVAPVLTATTVTFNLGASVAPISSSDKYFFLVANVSSSMASATVTSTLTSVSVNNPVGAGGTTGPGIGQNQNATITEITLSTAALAPGTNGVPALPAGGVLSAGTTLQILTGFSAISNGTQTITQINFNYTPSPSIDNEYIYRNTAPTGLVGATLAATDTSPDGDFTTGVSETISGTIIYYYLVVDVEVDVNTSTTAMTVAPSPTGVTFTPDIGIANSVALDRTYTFISSRLSTVVLNGGTTDDIPYVSKRQTDVTNTSPSLATLQVRDGGAGLNDPDNQSTRLTGLTIQLTNFAMVRKIALYDGGSEISGSEQTVSSGTIVWNLAGTPIIANEASTKDFTIKATFQNIVTDNAPIDVLVQSVSFNPAFSGFATSNGGGADTAPVADPANLIDVVATTLTFLANPANTAINTNFSLSLVGRDSQNNPDLDYSSPVSQVALSVSGGPGAISIDPVNPPVAQSLTPFLTAGAYNWTRLRINQSGTYTLTASDDAYDANLSDATGTITISSPASTITPGTTTPATICFGNTNPGSIPSTAAGSIPTAFFPLSNIVIAETDPAGISGSNGSYTFSVSLPIGFVFDQSVTSGLSVGGGSDLSGPSAYSYPGSNTVQFSFTLNGSSNTNSITMGGLKVGYTHPGTVSPSATGAVSITRAGGTATIAGVSSGTVLGTLSASQQVAAVTFDVTALAGNPIIAANTTSFNNTANAVKLVPSVPQTGTDLFTGSGVTFVTPDHRFNPSFGSVGTFTITYQKSNASGCQVIGTKDLTIYTSGITSLKPSYCNNEDTSADPVFTVSQTFIDQRTAFFAMPTGWSVDHFVYYDPNFFNGSYFGDFRPITSPSSNPASTRFDPTLPAYQPIVQYFGGQIPIGFAVCNAAAGVPCNGLSNTGTYNTYQWVTVKPAPSVSFTIPKTSFCVDEASVVLTGNPANSDVTANDFFDATLPPFVPPLVQSPSGTVSASIPPTNKVWSFSPATLGPGSANITYTYQSPTTLCTATSAPIAITVNTRPGTVSAGAITSGTSQIYCEGGSLSSFVANSVAGTTYNWYTDNPPTNQVGSSNTFLPPVNTAIAPATTNFYVTRTINGCESNKEPVAPTTPLTLSVEVRATPPKPVTNFDREFCVGTPVDATFASFLQIGAGNFIKWYQVGNPTAALTDVSSPSIAQISGQLGISTGAANIYSFDVTQTTGITVLPSQPFSGCEGIINATRINVTIKALPVISISASSDESKICTTGGIIQFTALDQGGLAANGTWSGIGASGVPNPIPTQGKLDLNPLTGASGSYTLQYSYTNSAGCTNFGTKPITVLPVINPNISIGNVCVGSPAAVVNNSTIGGSSTIDFAEWVFGDGTTLASGPSSAPVPLNTNNGKTTGTYLNPSQVYPGVGTFQLSGALISSDGCRYLVPNTPVTISPLPKIDFSWTDPCKNGTSATVFTAIEKTTPVTIPIATYQWNFNVNNSLTYTSAGTGFNPTVNYNKDGADEVELLVTTPQGCQDTKKKPIYIVPSYPIITPTNAYNQAFDSGVDGWVAGGLNSSWTLGTPNKTVINKAASAPNAWFTNLVPDQPESSWMLSPCFDFSSAQKPVISIDIWSNTPRGIDGAVLQYNVNGNIENDNNWIVLGTVGSGVNWYDDQGISNSPGNQASGDLGWTGDASSSGGKYSTYQKAIFRLDNLLTATFPPGKSDVVFRIAFASAQSTKDGFAFDNVFIGERSRVVLLESFTNASSAAPKNHNDIYRNFGSSSGELVKIQYHTPFPGDDALNALNTQMNNSRAAFYGITSSPTARVDGDFVSGNITNWLSPFYDDRVLTPSLVKLDVTVVKTGTTVKISTSITNNSGQSVPLAGAHIFTTVVEKSIVSASLLGNSGNSEFVYVAKQMLPTSTGLIIPNNLGAGQTYTAPDVIWENNTGDAIAVFVQSVEGNNKNVFQSIMLNNPPQPDVVTGLGDLLLVDKISVYPNPADEEITIQLPAPAPQRLQLQMVDQVGRVVNEHFITAGERSKTISTRDLAGGIYLLQLGSGNTSTRKKIMVVHGK